MTSPVTPLGPAGPFQFDPWFFAQTPLELSVISSRSFHHREFYTEPLVVYRKDPSYDPEDYFDNFDHDYAGVDFNDEYNYSK
ncbi:unnamed protein product [Urochloa humidicola]